MGLDSYIYSTKQPIEAVDFELPEDKEELFYARKWQDLHNMLQGLYNWSGGADPAFNDSPVRLKLVHLTHIKNTFDQEYDHKVFPELEPCFQALRDGYNIFYVGDY